MSANGPIIVATSDVVVAIPDSTAKALSSISGIAFSEQLEVAVIEALIEYQPGADTSQLTVALWEGAALTGTERQIWQRDPVSGAETNPDQIAIRYLDSKRPGANVQYSLSLQFAEASDAGQATVYGFTVTTFPGGVTPLVSND